MRQSQSSVLPETSPVGPPERRPVVERIAGWSARHKKTAVFGWLAPVAVPFVISQALGGKNLPSYDPGQAGRAERALHQAAPDYYGSAPEEVLIQARTAGPAFARDADMRQAVRQVVTALAARPKDAAHLVSPLTVGAQRSAGRSLVSADGHSALVTFVVPGGTGDQDRAVAADQQAVAAIQARHPGLLVAETGDASITRMIDNSLDFRQAEATSVPVTLILLLVVFGALVAAGIPILLAVSAVIAALAVVTISSRWLPVGSSTAEVVLIVGMTVGVDYSLFYLRREREERARGRSFPEALRIAAGTAGHPSRLWAALVRRVVAHPAIWGVTAAVALIALAAPALGMRLGEPALDVPPGQAVVATTHAIERAFPQTPSPAEVVVTGPGATGPRVLAAVAALQGRAAAAGPIREPVTATAIGGPAAGRALLVPVPLAGHW